MFYDQEFKEKVIQEVQQTKSISVVSKKHEIPASTIHGWLKKSSTKIDLKSQIKNKDLKVEVKTLRSKLADAELELLILKDLLKKTYQS
jgi:transposase-like protein|tara:strand:+ start:91 stop:357 length:267 start_codon:yes stop_codon:yes gene_type:complete